MKASPRRGGIGIRFVWIDENGDESEPWDHAPPAILGATNNQMELAAPTEALELAMSRHAPFDLSMFDRIEIRTDSQYVKEGVPLAIKVWSKNGWVKRDGGAVLNVSDWKRLLTVMRRIDREYQLWTDFEWKLGKTGKHSLAVDELAKESADKLPPGAARPNVVRKKKTTESVDPGSVRVHGQTITIRIVQAQWLGPPHNRSRYKYEVVDPGSPYNERMDWAESDHNLARGHTYDVQMNDDRRNPQIETVLREVEEDLSPYIESLKAIGTPATARQVADALGEQGIEVSTDAAKRRLDRLAEEERIARLRSLQQGRPYVYALMREGER